MLKNRIRFSFFILFLTTFSCFEEPNFDVYPSVKFENFYLSIDDAGVDALFVNFEYTDGDGDLGLSEFDRERKPYHNFDLVYHNNLPIEKNTVLGDSLFPYNFKRQSDGSAWVWSKVEVVRDVFKTYLVKRNYNHYNLFIDFYVKKNGKFEFFDFEALGVNHFYRAFPLLRENGKSSDALVGDMTYKIPRIKNFFKFDTLKMKLYIKDRALNKSNVAESDAFTLGDILRN